MEIDNKILVVTDQMEIREQLQGVLNNYTNVQYITSKEVKGEIDRIAPDIVLLSQTDDGSSVELIESIQNEKKAANIVFLTDREDFELLRSVIRAGAIEFFIIPEELTPLAEQLEKIVQLVKQQGEKGTAVTGQNFKRGRGQVYSFYSGKGGSGRTLLATGFAQTLKFESTAQVLLIDLNLQFGGAETFLSIESSRSLADLQPVIHELNENHIRSVTEKEKHSKLELLLSPRDAETAEKITEDFTAKLIRAARRNYDFVVMDLPATMTEVTYTALEESDFIYYILNPDTPSVRVLKTVEELFQQLHLDIEGRMELILNKIGKENELKVSDLKNLIQMPVAAVIRRDHKGVQADINQGNPIRKETREKKMIPAAKDLRKWVLKILK